MSRTCVVAVYHLDTTTGVRANTEPVIAFLVSSPQVADMWDERLEKALAHHPEADNLHIGWFAVTDSEATDISDFNTNDAYVATLLALNERLASLLEVGPDGQ